MMVAIVAGIVMGCLWLPTTASAAPLLQQTEAASRSIWAVLLPLTVAAIGVERAIELIWSYVEWILLGTQRMQPADVKGAAYLRFKSGSSLVLGVIMGVLLANYVGMRLFEYMTPYVPGFADAIPPLWDLVITGVIIGAGAKPIHELLGIITQLKNFFGYAAIHQRESASAALADGVLKLAESDRKMMIDVPGMGPARLSQAGPPSLLNSEEDVPAEPEPSQTERYVELLRNRTVG